MCVGVVVRSCGCGEVCLCGEVCVGGECGEVGVRRWVLGGRCGGRCGEVGVVGCVVRWVW